MDQILNRKFQVIDGGFATELITYFNHVEINNDPLWSSKIFLTNPNNVEKVHKRFLVSGADIIETCTYQASAEGISNYLKISTSDALFTIENACKLCVDTRNQFWENNDIKKDLDRLKPLVAGSIGPYGACIPGRMEYSGKYVDNMTLEELYGWHNPRVEAVIKGGVDICAFETIPAFKEAQAICMLMKDHPQIPAWITFSCQDEKSICYGDDIITIIDEIASIKNIIGIGINCTKPKYCEMLIKRLKTYLEIKKVDKFIVVYPDSGEIWNTDNTWTEPKDWIPVYDYVNDWVKAGANWIGGCCKVTANDISKIKHQLTLSTST